MNKACTELGIAESYFVLKIVYSKLFFVQSKENLICQIRRFYIDLRYLVYVTQKRTNCVVQWIHCITEVY